MLKSLPCLYAVAAVLTSGGVARAALHAYDGFNYTASTPLSGAAGGSGAWDSAWRAGPAPAVTDNITPTGLSYPGLQVSGRAVDTSAAATSIDFRDVGPYASGDVWISFLAKPEATNAITGGANFFGLSVYDGGDVGANAVMAIAKNSTTAKWGLVAFPTSTGGSGPHGTGTGNFGVVANDLPDLVVDATYMLAAKFHFATGIGADAADSVSLYVNPTPGATEPAAATVVYIDTISPLAGDMNFDRIRIGTQNGRDWIVDEVRIGDSFGDVAPAVPFNTDFNGFGGTNLDDFHILRANYLTGTTQPQGDANFDGSVNHVDFFLWRSTFLAAGGSLEGVSLEIPEPAAGGTALIGSIALAAVRRRQHGR